MKYDLNHSLDTPPAEPPTEAPPKPLPIGDPIPRPPSRKHSSNNVPTLSTFDAPLTPPAESSPSPSPPAANTSHSPADDAPPTTPFRGTAGTPLCTIHEDKKLRTSAKDWLMGAQSRGKEGESSKDVKVATGRTDPPRRSGGSNTDAQDEPVEKWHLPSAGVGERYVDGVIRVAPEIEEAMARIPPPVIKYGPLTPRVGFHRRQRSVGEGEREQSWWRRRVMRSGGGEVGNMHEAASSAETLEELPEEANEYTPSQAAPPEMIAAARARALAANAARQEEGRAAAEAEATARREEELVAEVTALRKEEREVEAAAVAVAIAAEAEEEATGTAAPMEKPERISDADKARAAVENEPHSPSWNGSTYIDGREHHYCGPDFPCQMDTQCDPSIRELWDRGYPVAPDAPPKRSALGGPMRSLFGMRKRPEQPEQKYTPVSVECIRVGNSATTIFSKATEPVILEDSTNEGARENGGAREGCRTMRGLRKFWGFWSNPGSKMGSRRGVIVTKSEDSLVVAERLGDRQLMDEPTESMASATATAAKNLAAAACYPVGESTVETAQPIQRVDSGTEMADGIEIVNPETSANK